MKRNLIPTLLALIGCTLPVMAVDPSVLTGPILNPANNHAYYLLNSGNWTDSQSTALTLGGNLVTINDAAENTWVTTTFLNYGGVSRDLWTGLNDAANEGSFQWANGEAFSFANWQPGQPDNGSIFYPSENYVHIFGGTTQEHVSSWVPGQWNDLQDVPGYNSNSGTSRQIYGVVEVVPEPTIGTLLLAAGSLLLHSRNRIAGKAKK